MSDNTILGGPSSAANTPDPTADRATSTDPVGNRDESGDDDGSSADADTYPGDVETAVQRSRLYALVSFALERPDDEIDAAIADGAFGDPLVASAAAIDEDVAAAAREVREQIIDRDADSLHGDWASLFGVEEGLTVSPYQVTYIPGPLMTNVRQIADIRGFYEAFGLAIAEGENDRADRVGFQVEFVSHLAEREAYLRDSGDEEGVAVVVDAQRSFLEDHLGRWYWRFADEVSKHDESGAYGAVTGLLAALVEHELERFDLDPDWVPDDPAVTEWTEDVFGDSGRGCGGCGGDPDGIDTDGIGGTDADGIGGTDGTNAKGMDGSFPISAPTGPGNNGAPDDGNGSGDGNDR